MREYLGFGDGIHALAESELGSKRSGELCDMSLVVLEGISEHTERLFCRSCTIGMARADKRPCMIGSDSTLTASPADTRMLL